MTDKGLKKLQADTEKRLKFAEDRIKILTDALTTSKDVEKILDAYHKRMGNDPNFSNKYTMREFELSEKARTLRERELDKELAKRDKEIAQLEKKMMTEAQAKQLEARLSQLEAKVAAALAK